MEEDINKKIEEIIKEMEFKKSEIDDLLNIAKQTNDQISSIINNANDVIKQNEEQAKNKLQSVEQISLDAENKKSEIEELKSKIDSSFKEIKDFYQNQEEKYSIFYKQIEEELKAGTTSVNLSKSFADKVGEYRLGSRIWAGCFIALLTGLVGYYGYTTFSTDEIKTTQDVWRHLAFRAPLYYI